jgi:hypothetical protein
MGVEFVAIEAPKKVQSAVIIKILNFALLIISQ